MTKLERAIFNEMLAYYSRLLRKQNKPVEKTNHAIYANNSNSPS